MIRVTQIGHQPRLLNPDLIEYIEMVPDTMIVMVNGHRYIVGESPEKVINRIVAFRRRCTRNRVVAGSVGTRTGNGTEPDFCDGSTHNPRPLALRRRHLRPRQRLRYR